jgi:dihydrofolate reductase
MNLIVAVDENWAIGYKGDLLIRISEDMKYFKEKTVNNTVVMGRVTFETLPNKKPLSNRTNIVLTHDKDFKAEGAIICHNVEEVLTIANTSDQETFIIGGEKIYKLFLPYITTAYITKIYHKFTADKYIPNFVNSSHWELSEKSDILTNKDGIKYQFLVYAKEVGRYR